MLTIEYIRGIAKERFAKVAIGVSSEREDFTSKTVSSAIIAQKKGFAKAILVGDGSAIQRYLTDELEIVHSDRPWFEIVKLVKENYVDAGIRGSLSATKVIKEMKKSFKLTRTHRISLLSTFRGELFFFAPVGIDEGNELIDKQILVEHALNLHKQLDIDPKIAVLSGGRKEDFGRSSKVDKTLKEGEFLANMIKERLVLDIKHYGILIEDAIKEKATFILAPDGISGNLIFRTLEFLGGGRGIGAVYTDIIPKNILIDVSRATTNYVDTLAFASFMSRAFRKKV
ncbi:MAG: methanogenesis marker protein Mmp4/MtxX [Candidatus Methylarchaceae archaeon HK01B]|nr:methanogenesis marker protein Mmp4/MtxX [Candidatus Methylarchaceae archaeon HK02M1]MCP8319289.1 methanogenesis marker protein Mmp4/MtxX [Candidatus Methylarchaceae archaeon HK01B]